MTHKRQCPECDRVFDLLDSDDASEWAYGHDCETDNPPVSLDPFEATEAQFDAMWRARIERAGV